MPTRSMAYNHAAQAPGQWNGPAAVPGGYGALGNPYFASNNSSFSNYDTMVRTKTSSTGPSQLSERVLSDVETIDLFHNSMYAAREEQVPEGRERSEDALRVKMLTLDFKRAGIGSLPDEAVDTIKRDVAMIVLSHNFLTYLPTGFGDCVKVTYLNLRGNLFETFPPPLLKLQSLQILDLSRNKLDVLPEEISNMKALRVLSFSNNRLTALPYALGDMDSLKILKLSGNPLNESIVNLLKAEESVVSSGVPVAEHENDARITLQVKKFLRTEAAAMDSGGESSESPIDTPRPLKRNPSLRFPVNPAAAASSRSPSSSRPAIPTKSHFRAGSGQGNNSQTQVSRTPSGSGPAGANDKSRLDGDSITSAAQSSKSRRMGIVQKQNQLGSLDESSANRNSLHLRGTSHNSALKEKARPHARSVSGAGSTSSADFDRSQASFFHRLSSLPEQRRSVVAFNPSVEGAKSLLFSLHSLHPYMSSLLHLASDDPSKRSSLERVFYNSSNQLDALDHALQAYADTALADENQRKQQDQTVRRACRACLVAYAQVGRLLVQNAQHLVMNADPRYLRMLMILIYGSTIEAGNAFESMAKTTMSQSGQSQGLTSAGGSLRELVPQLTVPSIGPSNQRMAAAMRSRQEGAASINRPLPMDAQLQNEKPSSQPQSAVPPRVNGRSRSSSRSSNYRAANANSTANTPRSGESFFTPPTPLIATEGMATVPQPENQQDALFDKLMRSFQKWFNETQQTFVKISSDLNRRLERARSNKENKTRIELWTRLASQARTTLVLCQNQNEEFARTNFQDLEVRNSPVFWQRVQKVGHSFVDFCTQIKIASNSYRGEMVLGETVKAVRPCFRSFRTAMDNFENSPWHFVLTNSPSIMNQQLSIQTQWSTDATASNPSQNKLNGHNQGRNRSGSGSSPYMPTTPLSAALGPAAAATVSSSGTGSFDRSFQGDVFQRAAFALNSQHTHFRRNG